MPVVLEGLCQQLQLAIQEASGPMQRSLKMLQMAARSLLRQPIVSSMKRCKWQGIKGQQLYDSVRVGWHPRTLYECVSRSCGRKSQQRLEKMLCSISLRLDTEASHSVFLPGLALCWYVTVQNPGFKVFILQQRERSVELCLMSVSQVKQLLGKLSQIITHPLIFTRFYWLLYVIWCKSPDRYHAITLPASIFVLPLLP